VSGSVRIYLGNLPPGTTVEAVRALLAAHGEVADIDLITDRETNEPRGFGFATMPAEAAARAVAELDGLDWQGHALRVNESHDRGARPPRRSW
jgi:RNA recognition motif-containing protein